MSVIEKFCMSGDIILLQTESVIVVILDGAAGGCSICFSNTVPTASYSSYEAHLLIMGKC